MARYTSEEVKIEGSYPINKILELSMDIRANCHGFLTYGGLVPVDIAKQCAQQSADGQIVTVYLRDEIEFCGCPHIVVADTQNDHCYLRVTLVTSSQLMDTNPCNRFYQDNSRTYADIITEAYYDSGTGSLAAVRGKEKIYRPILQYRETDWQFTLRMAGRLGTVVIPNTTSREPQVSLGVPKRQIYDETNNIDYSISRNAAEYRRKFALDDTIGYQNFLCYKMKSDNRYKLGDSVKIDGKVLTVMRKSLTYAQEGDTLKMVHVASISQLIDNWKNMGNKTGSLNVAIGIVAIVFHGDKDYFFIKTREPEKSIRGTYKGDEKKIHDDLKKYKNNVKEINDGKFKYEFKLGLEIINKLKNKREIKNLVIAICNAGDISDDSKPNVATTILSNNKIKAAIAADGAFSITNKARFGVEFDRPDASGFVIYPKNKPTKTYKDKAENLEELLDFANNVGRRFTNR